MDYDMLCGVAARFPESNILVVTDSWFGNNCIWKPLRKKMADRALFPGFIFINALTGVRS